MVDIGSTRSAVGEPMGLSWASDEEQLFKALSMGIRDYVRKCGFKSVVIGLSGGIDSALTAVLAVDALGAENVMGVAMPSKFSSAGSVNDAAQLAANLGIRFERYRSSRRWCGRSSNWQGPFTVCRATKRRRTFSPGLRGVTLWRSPTSSVRWY